MIPDTYTAIDEADVKKFQKMLDLLDYDDDFQNVYHINFTNTSPKEYPNKIDQ